MPSRHSPQTFDAFVTTKLGRGSSHVGLHIVHNVVSSVLGGDIVAKSVEGGRSHLPRRLAPHRHQPARAAVLRTLLRWPDRLLAAKVKRRARSAAKIASFCLVQEPA